MNIAQEFRDFLNESIIKDTIVGKKKTKVLKIEITDEILKDFENTSGNTYKHKKEYKSQGYAWTLFFNKNIGKLWGVSGDFWFGSAPNYLNDKYGGNIKAAEEVFSNFIKDYGIKGIK